MVFINQPSSACETVKRFLTYFLQQKIDQRSIFIQSWQVSESKYFPPAGVDTGTSGYLF